MRRNACIGWPALIGFVAVACAAAPSAESSPPAAPPRLTTTLPVAATADAAVVSEPASATAVPVATGAPSTEERRRALSFPDAPRHRSSVLGGPPKPSKLAPGAYACRTGAEYRLRPCTVTKDDAGFTWIEMPSSLIGFRAVVYDEGASLVLDGASRDERPFGCFGCDERCSLEPGSCMCQEMLPGASRECLAQPITVKLQKSGPVWRGTLKYMTYLNSYEGTGDARHVSGWTRDEVKLVVEIAPANAAAPPSNTPKR